eukprot:15336140-Ditylum_brightwellii.AAC.2
MTLEEQKQEIEDINATISKVVLTPEQHISIPNQVWWLDTIHNAHTIVQYLKTVLSLQCYPQEDESILDDISAKLGPDQDVYQGDPSC